MNRHVFCPALAAAPAVFAGSGAAAGATDGGSLLPALPGAGFSWSGYFEALAILCLVLAGVWAVLWLVKRRGSGRLFASSTPSMRIENRLALGPKQWLVVVRYLDRRLILGVTDKTVTLVTELYEQECASERQLLETPDNAGPSLQKKIVPGARVAERDESRGGRPDIRPGADAPLSFASLLKKT